MDCSEVAKYLYAFADGELPSEDAPPVSEHLTTCPQCMTKIRLQKEFRGRVGKMFAGTTVPASLRPGILAALQAEAASEAKPSRRTIIRLYKPWHLLAAAAAIALMVAGAYQLRLNKVEAEISPAQFVVTDTSKLGIQLADNVYAVHKRCSRMGEAAHDPSLPRDGLDAAETIRATLDYPMLRCSTLDNRSDTTFVSASYCELTDCEGAKKRGGHLVYRFDDGRCISLISVPHLNELKRLHSTADAASKSKAKGKREYYILQPSTATKQHPVTVTAFNCPKASHIVCVEFAPTESMDMIEHMSARYGDAQVGSSYEFPPVAEIAFSPIH